MAKVYAAIIPDSDALVGSVFDDVSHVSFRLELVIASIGRGYFIGFKILILRRISHHVA